MINTHQCCQIPPNRNNHTRSRFDNTGSILPSMGLALIPKCPVCIAAWVLFFSGLGLSLAAAASLRAVLIIAYVAIQFFLMYRIALRVYRSYVHPAEKELS